MKKTFILCCVAILGLSISGTKAQPASGGGQDMQEAMKALGMLMNAGATNSTAVHQSQLKALLPAEFEGMKRSNVEAGKNAAFGMNVVYAQATYKKEGADLTVKLSDISSMGGLMKMAQFAWTQTEMERETDTGYERTTNIDGNPAQERFTTEGKDGEIQVMVDGRFMVEVNGNGLDMTSLHDLLKAVDLGKLAALKPEAPAAP